jgi:hypothetical protein
MSNPEIEMHSRVCKLLEEQIKTQRKTYESISRLITVDGELTTDDLGVIRSIVAQTIYILTDGEEGDKE